MEPSEEAKHYGYSFLQKINKKFDLYGYGHRRLIIPSTPLPTPSTDGIISYAIIGGDIEPMPWEQIKTNHPNNAALEERV